MSMTKADVLHNLLMERERFTEQDRHLISELYDEAEKVSDIHMSERLLKLEAKNAKLVAALEVIAKEVMDDGCGAVYVAEQALEENE